MLLLFAFVFLLTCSHISFRNRDINRAFLLLSVIAVLDIATLIMFLPFSFVFLLFRSHISFRHRDINRAFAPVLRRIELHSLCGSKFKKQVQSLKLANKCIRPKILNGVFFQRLSFKNLDFWA